MAPESTLMPTSALEVYLRSQLCCRSWTVIGNATLLVLPANLPSPAVHAQCCSSSSRWSSPLSSHHRLSCRFHWLRAPEWIKFKLKVIVYRALHGTAPWYLYDRLSHVADMPSRDDFGHQLRPTYCLSVASCHSWQSIICFCCCWPTAVEQSSRWDYICFITDSENWKHIYFGSHIRSLLCSLFCGCSLHMVVLAVIYFGHLKIYYVT